MEKQLESKMFKVYELRDTMLNDILKLMAVYHQNEDIAKIFERGIAASDDLISDVSNLVESTKTVNQKYEKQFNELMFRVSMFNLVIKTYEGQKDDNAKLFVEQLVTELLLAFGTVKPEEDEEAIKIDIDATKLSDQAKDYLKALAKKQQEEHKPEA